MKDRELLELAAAAVGYEIDAKRQAERDAVIDPDTAGLWLVRGDTWWNPLTNDGQALRLAVAKNVLRCHMDLFHRFYDQEIGAGREASDATRRALVRAAVGATKKDERRGPRSRGEAACHLPGPTLDLQDFGTIEPAVVSGVALAEALKQDRIKALASDLQEYLWLFGFPCGKSCVSARHWR